MKGTFESLLRLVNLTTSGLLAGSLGFGEAALMPGWQEERSKRHDSHGHSAEESIRYMNAIGPLALASSLALAVGGSDRSGAARTLDAISAVSLAGVLGTTMLVTVPITKRLDHSVPVDYADDDTASLSRNFHRAHAIRTALGIGAFFCAAASNVLRKVK
jgi:hypothetical protein